jgi:hypothetical protein
MMLSRRFTPPWDIDDNGACFIVRDNNGHALSYVYCENEPGRRTAASLLTRDEARRSQYCKAAGLAETAAALGFVAWKSP